MDAYKKLISIFSSVRDKIPFCPKIALVLGSGLGDFAEAVDLVSTLDYSDIENFPQSTVHGHKGRFVFGYLKGVPVVIMQGRVHYYEGYDIKDVVLPIRLMKLMGAEILFLTNAAGGMGEDFKAGDFMLITDHISSFVPSPLIGGNIGALGERFPDMSCVYDKILRSIVKEAARALNMKLKEGVYCQLTGPAFETPAEVRMCKILGASAVGMSTAVEAMTAVHAGMRVVGVSAIANLACGITGSPLSHEEVNIVTAAVSDDFKKLITASIVEINNRL